MARRVLVLYPRYLDYLHLKELSHKLQCTFVFEDFKLGDIVRQGYAPDGALNGADREHIDDIIRQSGQYDGIIGTHDYPGTLVASLCAEQWGFTFTSVESILFCQHKYYFRKKLQQELPEATPEFHLIDSSYLMEVFEFPLFLKPVKSSFSRLAHSVSDHTTLSEILDQGLFDPLYLSLFNEVFEEYTGIALDANSYIAEGLLTGHQVSLEGYVYNESVTVLGIIDALMYEGTLSFERFTYPSQLAEGVQARMRVIADKAIRSLGLNNTFFSVELMYNPEDESIFIIEINPRISTQFADFFQHVHGVNSYEILVALTLGEEPPALSHGQYSHAASFPLRLFDDKQVDSVPTESDITQLKALFPDMLLQVVAQEGKCLSEIQQDGNSYLYAIVNLAAHSYEELEQKRDQLLELLPIVFS